jgi:hypothetical protein
MIAKKEINKQASAFNTYNKSKPSLASTVEIGLSEQAGHE